MNGWQIELWAEPPPVADGKLLHTGFDPAEFFVMYKDALKHYKPKQLMILLSAGFEVYRINHEQLREMVKSEYSVP